MSFTPEGKGWIQKYTELASKGDIQLDFDRYQFDSEKNLYINVQDTGIIYGYPTNFIFYPEIVEKWATADSYKLLLYEGFVLSNLLNDFSHDIDPKELIEFYEHLNHKKESKFNFFGKKDPYEKLDLLLSKRIHLKVQGDSFWLNYLSNSFIYSDLILYHKMKAGYNYSDLEDRMMLVQKYALRVIIAAATSNGIIGEKEKAVFDRFLQSSNLLDSDKNKIEALLLKGLKIHELDLPDDLSWIVKRWFLELALIVILADNTIDPKEQKFLENLASELNFDEIELEDAQHSIQSFILNNFTKLPYFTDRSEFSQIYGNVSKKISNIVSTNKDKLAVELMESKELMALITKSTFTELSKEERKKVRRQLGDLAKSIPALTVFMLPGGAILMPILLKILPNLIPTAFRSNVLDEKEDSKAKEEEE